MHLDSKINQFFLFALILQINVFYVSAQTKPSTTLTHTISEVLFKENKGQVYDQNYNPRPDVLFSGVSGNLVYHLKNRGVSYQLSRVDEWKELDNFSHPSEQNLLSEKKKIASKTTTYRVDINWLNANPNFIIKKGDATAGCENYYTSNCKNGITDVKSYKEITYQNIYHGIDIKWYQKEGVLEYDFIIQSGADYKQIQLEIKGAEKLSITKNGELEIKTPLGIIIEKAPLVYQNKKIISSSWQLNNNVVSFKLGDYDTRYELIIDPAVRLWGTYYGGTGIEYGYGCATDATGNVYIAGFTQTTVTAIMATTGAHQTASGGGTNDSFLSKFNTNGTRIWATFYGGGGLDVGTACAVDPTGNVYMSGYTDSNNGIATLGSHQTFTVGDVEAFLVKFNSAGVRQWGTYYADLLNEYGYGCATDASGNAYLCGYTTSVGTVLGTPGCHQSTHGGGLQDAFLVKFNSAGVRQWGTYYGGTGNDFGFNCTTDGTGNVFLTGRTASTNSAAISTVGSHQPISGGNFDAYLVKFNSVGVRQWGTHYGGFGIDYGYSCAADASGNVFLSGSTDSNNSTEIATTGSHQSIFGGGPADAFVAKFNVGGTRLWGTYYGGVNYEEGVACVTDVNGNVYIGGQTSSSTSTIMATTGAHQPIYGGGAYDAYLVKFTTNGIRVFGTYYGETGMDYGFAISVDPNSYIYLVGYTSTLGGTSIATVGSHQPTNGGGTFDAFVAKFFDCPLILTDAINQINVSCYGLTDGAVTATVVSPGSNFTYSWIPTNSNLQTQSNLAAGFYTCVITNTCGSAASQTVQITQPTSVSLTATSNNSIQCIGDTSTLTALGSGGTSPFSYTWSTGPVSNFIIVSPSANTNYTITGTDANGCTITTTITQNVSICTNFLGQNKFEELSISVYPNPNCGDFFISSNANLNITIINALGQEVNSFSLNDMNNHKHLITNLDNGIYLFVEQHNIKSIKQKVVVNK